MDRLQERDHMIKELTQLANDRGFFIPGTFALVSTGHKNDTRDLEYKTQILIAWDSWDKKYKEVMINVV